MDHYNLIVTTRFNECLSTVVLKFSYFDDAEQAFSALDGQKQNAVCVAVFRAHSSVEE